MKLIMENWRKYLNEVAGDPDASWWEKLLGLDKPDLGFASAVDIGGLGAATSAIRHSARTLRAAKKAKKLADQVKKTKIKKADDVIDDLTRGGQKVPLTPAQNKAMKEIYIEISRFINLYRDWALKKGVDLSDFPDVSDFVIPPGFNIKRLPGQSPIFRLTNTSKYKHLFPDLDKDLILDLMESETQLVRGSTGKVERININPNKIKSSSHSFKRSLHHELQHIVNKGASGTSGLKGTIKYLSNSGEIVAHAKEAAYDYVRLFPNEKYFSINKLTSASEAQMRTLGLSSSEFNKYKNYSNFGDPFGGSKRIADKIKADSTIENPEELIKLMRTSGKQFTDYAEYFYQIFKGP